MPSPVSGSTPPTLPYDVLVTVVSMLDRPTLKQARLCCKWLAKEAARHLFATVTFHMRADDMERVIAIANNSMTADAVKELFLDQVPRLPDYTFKEWKRYARPLGVLENPNLPPLTKELYLEFVVQRKEPSLWRALHLPGPSICESLLPTDKDTSKSWRQQGRRLQRACINFEAALLKLRNLRQLGVHIAEREEAGNLFWRGYAWDTEFPDFFGVDQESGTSEEVAPLAFILRILGKRNSSSDSLTSIRMYLGGESWWGLQDLHHAWMSPILDHYDSENGDSEMESLDGRYDSVEEPNCAMAEEAFTHLTDIRIEFGPQDEMSHFMEALARYLNKAKKLDRLDLYASNFERLRGEVTYDMLTKINATARWPMIRHLNLDCLELTEKSILRLLSLVAPTLEELSLTRCVLFGEESSWSDVYDKMRLISFQALYKLRLQSCYQHTLHPELLDSSDWSSSKAERDAGWVTHVMVQAECYFIIGYTSDIYQYILKETDTKPQLRLLHKMEPELFPRPGPLEDDLIET